MKKGLVCGTGRFIGHRMVRRLKREDFWVRGVDLKYSEFCKVEADDFRKGNIPSLKEYLC